MEYAGLVSSLASHWPSYPLSFCFVLSSLVDLSSSIRIVITVSLFYLSSRVLCLFSDSLLETVSLSSCRCSFLLRFWLPSLLVMQSSRSESSDSRVEIFNLSSDSSLGLKSLSVAIGLFSRRFLCPFRPNGYKVCVNTFWRRGIRSLVNYLAS